MMTETEIRHFIDRRLHRMFVTENSEYHLKENVCVGIRSLRSGKWITRAKALKARLIGGISSMIEVKLAAPSFPKVGESLLFMTDDGEDVVTTRIKDIRRPPREALNFYVRV
jgi:hypothetical protein